jgi:hypothetical protein
MYIPSLCQSLFSNKHIRREAVAGKLSPFTRTADSYRRVAILARPEANLGQLSLSCAACLGLHTISRRPICDGHECVST